MVARHQLLSLTNKIPWQELAVTAVECAKLFGLSKDRFLRTIARSPTFPERIHLSPAAWKAGEVIDWRDANRVILRREPPTMSAAEKLWPEVMDLNTAAEYLHVHPVTLREWKRKGDGPPGRKLGGRWRFLRSALDAHLTGTKPPAWPANLTSLNLAERKGSSGSASPRPMDSQYLEALGLPTATSRPNGRRSSTPSSTGSRD